MPVKNEESTNEATEVERHTLSSPTLNTPHEFAERLGRLKLDRFSGIFMIIAFVVVYSIWLPNTFPTTTTLDTLLTSQAVTALVALAVLFPLAAGAFDLSVAQNVTVTSLVCAALMQNSPHVSPALAILCTLGVGLCIGVVNGWLVAIVGLNSFIATLGTTSLLTAISSLIGDGNYFGPFSSSFTSLTSGHILGIPIEAFFVLIVGIVAWYALEHTAVGRRIYAVGLNPESARLAGIRTKRIVFAQLVVCGVLASFAAIVLTSSTDSSSETVGTAYLLPAFAAAFLGTTQLKPGRFHVWGTLIAILLLGVGITGLQLAGLNIWVTYAFNGVALLLAVSIAAIAERRAASGGRRLRRRRATVDSNPTFPAAGDSQQ